MNEENNDVKKSYPGAGMYSGSAFTEQLYTWERSPLIAMRTRSVGSKVSIKSEISRPNERPVSSTWPRFALRG